MHVVEPSGYNSGLIHVAMPDRECGTQCATTVPSGRLNPDALKGTIAQYLSVRHAIQSDPASHAQILRSRLTSYRACELEQNLVGNRLNGSGEIEVLGLQRRLLCARFHRKQSAKAVVDR